MVRPNKKQALVDLMHSANFPVSERVATISQIAKKMFQSKIKSTFSNYLLILQMIRKVSLKNNHKIKTF